MPEPFHRLTLDEFTALLDRFPFTRRINAVHMHHTWRPSHAQYRGHESIAAMWRYHTQHNGWSDIAQHLTIGPDGSIWTGRDWNSAPASASGHNGNSRVGPFMFEMIGDFDTGRDPWGGEQKRVTLEVVARIQKKFDLPPESLRFHSQMGPKTCPGTQIDYDATVAEIHSLHDEEGREWPVPQVVREPLRFPGVILESQMGFERTVRDAMEALQGTGTGAARSITGDNPDPADAEPSESEMAPEDVPVFAGLENATHRAPGASARSSGRDRFTPAVRAAMRPHVINLDRGRFSSDGIYSTSPADLDAIFGEEMERAVQDAVAAGDRLRVMFYAHGGLVGEGDGLWAAHLAAPWWRQNNVYPLYFVWETGLMPQLRQVLFGSGPAAAPRGILAEAWDNSVEAAARALRLPMDIWTNMKRSAAAAVHEGGGALRVAQLLKQFCDLHPDAVELHAVGHSAGSIFHSHFLPTALDLGVPAFRTVSLLAPAIRVDAFHERLAPRLGQGIDRMTIYTMSRDWERDDSCMGIYRKSLLYLIRNALEPEREDALSGPAARPTKGIPILGLEESLREDPELARLFGLHGAPGENGEVVWSVSRSTEGISASHSRTHGGFDNDPATMHGVAARIHGFDSTGELVPLPPEIVEGRSRSLGGIEEVELLEGAEFFAGLLQPGAAAPEPQPGAPSLQPAPVAPTPPSSTGIPYPGPIVVPSHSGRRRAFCVGIDSYQKAPLMGCVADARRWADTLRGMSFDVDLLDEADATREGIVAHLTELIGGSRRGDVLVFQYAGHGTWMEDLDGDEPDGRDEALCPIDHHTGAYIIDDDLGAIWDLIPEGVNVTCFMDCCHSGTINRVVGGTPHPSGGGPNLRARYLPVTREMQRDMVASIIRRIDGASRQP